MNGKNRQIDYTPKQEGAKVRINQDVASYYAPKFLESNKRFLDKTATVLDTYPLATSGHFEHLIGFEDGTMRVIFAPFLEVVEGQLVKASAIVGAGSRNMDVSYDVCFFIGDDCTYSNNFDKPTTILIEVSEKMVEFGIDIISKGFEFVRLNRTHAIVRVEKGMVSLKITKTKNNGKESSK